MATVRPREAVVVGPNKDLSTSHNKDMRRLAVEVACRLPQCSCVRRLAAEHACRLPQTILARLVADLARHH